MTPAIRALLEKLLKREERRLAARACAARYGLDFGVQAAAALVVVRAAIEYVRAA